jgi:kinesin family member C1
MTGSGREEERGLIPRSVEHIISQINEMKAAGWVVEATYSMLEVYNESLIDLLSSPGEHPAHTNSTDIGSSCSSKQLKIIFQNDRVVIPQLTSIPMVSDSVDDALDQLQDILCKANSARTTASTAMNERSSRSHVLFMMNLQATHQDGTILQGGLRLVDLAGSERLDRCGTSSDAQRFRETVNINKSLSCLGEVFMALGHKASHVPFRNSKLTMLLQVIRPPPPPLPSPLSTHPSPRG